MLEPIFLPVDWFVTYEPAWLGPAVMLAGVALLTVTYVTHSQGDATVVATLVLLAGIAALPWAFQNRQLVVVVLSFTGSWFQGVGTVRGYLKLTHYAAKVPGAIRAAGGAVTKRLAGLVRRIRRLSTSNATRTAERANARRGGREADGEGLSSKAESVGWWLVFQLLGLLAVATSVWVGVGLTTVGALTIPSLTTDVVISWTLLTAFGAVLGLGWRFWSVRDAFPATALLGVVLLAAGAEIYNFRTLEMDITLFFAAKAMYVLGFLGATAVLILARKSPDTATAAQGGRLNGR
jgi:hypothetical protein